MNQKTTTPFESITLTEFDRTQNDYIGKGRSGVVSRRETDGVTYAVKAFTAQDTLTKLVCTMFLGAPNPYAWNRDVIECAHARREILRTLLPVWKDVEVEVAQSFGTNWNEELDAYEIITEFVDGRHAALHHPFSSEREHESANLRNNVLLPLQTRLKSSGLKGMLWQAGYGNPSAESNFMLRNGKWVWIDLESGVPALFPLNVIKLFTFYLPEAYRNRRASFDEVAVPELKKYVNLPEIRDAIDSVEFDQLLANVQALEYHQDNWTNLKRIEKSVQYAFARNRINEAEVEKFCVNPVSWYAREGIRFTGLVFSKSLKLPRKLLRKIISMKPLSAVKSGSNFVFRSEIRRQQVADFLNRSVDTWSSRNQLELSESDRLRGKIIEEHSSPYLTDFFVHIAIKPFVKIFEIVALPALFTAGVIDARTTAFLVLFSGSIARTVYTLTRIIIVEVGRIHKLPGIIQSWIAVRKSDLKDVGLWIALARSIMSLLHIPRLIALLVGTIPSIGNAAYLAQMGYSASTEETELSEFLIYDLITRIGAKVPIFGGQDSGVEHFFNRLPSYLFRHRSTTNSL